MGASFDASCALTPVAVRDLRSALEASLELLDRHRSPRVTPDQREATRDLLARRLLRRAAMGETNQARLVAYAVGSLV